jgi:hypothetical protein
MVRYHNIERLATFGLGISFPNSYHRAGAQWRSHASADDKEQQRWDIETYNHWLSILASELNEPGTTVKSGLGVRFTLL